MRTNQRGQDCTNCGEWCEPGQGRLVHYSQEDIDDGMAPAVDMDPGWHVYCLDQDACLQRLQEARRRVAELRASEAAKEEAERRLFNPQDGEYLWGENGASLVLAGNHIPWRGGFNIYGGGEEFVLTPDGGHVWHVRNNGMDGDDWSRNNIRTGGAGAIGHRFPATEERLAFLREHCPHAFAEPEPSEEPPPAPGEQVIRIHDQGLHTQASYGLLDWGMMLRVHPAFPDAARTFANRFPRQRVEYGGSVWHVREIPEARFRDFLRPYQEEVWGRLQAIGAQFCSVGLGDHAAVITGPGNPAAMMPLNIPVVQFVARLTSQYCLFRTPATDEYRVRWSTYNADGRVLPEVHPTVQHAVNSVLSEGAGPDESRIALRLIDQAETVEVGRGREGESVFTARWRDGGATRYRFAYGGCIGAGGDGESWSEFLGEEDV